VADGASDWLRAPIITYSSQKKKKLLKKPLTWACLGAKTMWELRVLGEK